MVSHTTVIKMKDLEMSLNKSATILGMLARIAERENDKNLSWNLTQLRIKLDSLIYGTPGLNKLIVHTLTERVK